MSDWVVSVANHERGSEVAVNLRRSLSNNDDTSILELLRRSDLRSEGIELANQDGELLLVRSLREDVALSSDARFESMVDLDERGAGTRDGRSDVGGNLDADLSGPGLARRNRETSDASDLLVGQYGRDDLSIAFETVRSSEEGLHGERDGNLFDGLGAAVDDGHFDLSLLAHVGNRGASDRDRDVLIRSEDGLGFVARLGVEDGLQSGVLNRHCELLGDSAIESHGNIDVSLCKISV